MQDQTSGYYFCTNISVTQKYYEDCHTELHFTDLTAESRCTGLKGLPYNVYNDSNDIMC